MLPYKHAQPTHTEHKHPLSHQLLWGAGAVSVGLSLAPYLLPMMGIGSDLVRLESENFAHYHGDGAGMGLAGNINSLLAATPLIGASLAGAGLYPIVASAVIGIGGVLLANWLEGKENLSADPISWSGIIRNAAIATSALIALPSLLTGITTGLNYIALLAGDDGSFIKILRETIGASAGHSGKLGGISAAIPHLLLCGASILPTGLAQWLGTSRIATEAAHITASAAQPLTILADNADKTRILASRKPMPSPMPLLPARA